MSVSNSDLTFSHQYDFSVVFVNAECSFVVFLNLCENCSLYL